MGGAGGATLPRAPRGAADERVGGVRDRGVPGRLRPPQRGAARRDATRTARRAAGVRGSALGAAGAMPGGGADVTASSPRAHCRCSLTPRRSKVAQARHEFVRLALRHGGAGGAAAPLGAAKRPRRASKRLGARVGAVRQRPLGA